MAPFAEARARLRFAAMVGHAVVLILAGAAAALADTVVVTTDATLVWNRPRGASFVVAQLALGTRLDVVGRSGDWYEVVLPVPSSSGELTGFVRASQVVVDSRGPMSEAARRAATANSGSTNIWMRPAFLNIGIARRVSVDFVRTSRAFGDRYAENGSITATHGGGTGLQFDAMGSQAVWRHVALGLGVSYRERTGPTRLTATIPHPVVLNRPRVASFETTSPASTELAIHLPLTWIPLSGLHVKIMVFGGPSVFRVTQDVVTDVTVSDPPPYNALVITGATTTRMQGTNTGFHIGGDVAYFFSNAMGVGTGARYSRAAAHFEGDAAVLDAVAGATELVAGLRFRF